MQTHLDTEHASDLLLGECIERFLADLTLRAQLGQVAAATLASYRSNLKLVAEELLTRPAGAIRRPEIKAEPIFDHHDAESGASWLPAEKSRAHIETAVALFRERKSAEVKSV